VTFAQGMPLAKEFPMLFRDPSRVNSNVISDPQLTEVSVSSTGRSLSGLWSANCFSVNCHCLTTLAGEAVQKGRSRRYNNYDTVMPDTDPASPAIIKER